jgi:2-polyprenyl-3-methyl-5-hydroxy-6-metoxy-1,4-benzoquinol methylase
MKDNPMTLYGQALQDYYKGDHSATLQVVRDDGLEADIPVRIFFRDEDEFSYIEQLGVGLCQGKILDIGAGAGIHSLYLQKKQMNVTAIDISPEAVEIMKTRGVVNAECHDIFDFSREGFDTLLLMSHGIGITGTVDGLQKFLKLAYKITTHTGILLFDTLDVRYTEDPKHIAYHEKNKKSHRNMGEITMQFSYKGIKGAMFSWLHLIPETLIMESDKAGWNCEIVHREPTGDYLARLSKK